MSAFFMQIPIFGIQPFKFIVFLPHNYPSKLRVIVMPVKPKTFAELKRQRGLSQPKRDDRAGSTQRGYDRRWRKARMFYLLKHPLCVKCKAEGRTEQATVVDHIIPHKGDKKLFWDRKNWQPLCTKCHNTKTATQDGGFGHVN